MTDLEITPFDRQCLTLHTRHKTPEAKAMRTAALREEYPKVTRIETEREPEQAEMDFTQHPDFIRDNVIACIGLLLGLSIIIAGVEFM